VPTVEIVNAPPGMWLVDGGRHGWAHLGVSWSGAFAPASLALANRLVGNAEDAAGFEVVLGPCELHVPAPTVLGIVDATGGRVVTASDRWTLPRCAVGLRTWVAVRGGLTGDVVLGSATHVVGAGDRIAIGSAVAGQPHLDHVTLPRHDRVVTLAPGPRAEWIDIDALDCAWTVSTNSDRTGVRLDGQAIVVRHNDLPSEGTVIGGVQITPAGQPIVLGPDAGTTGGYPIVAVVPWRDLDVIAQARPGDTLRFDVRPARVRSPRRA
jgi:biotin-dependent carboxylase-like uncharacterized protein